jgi:hypothetical protein
MKILTERWKISHLPWMDCQERYKHCGDEFQSQRIYPAATLTKAIAFIPIRAAGKRSPVLP